MARLMGRIWGCCLARGAAAIERLILTMMGPWMVLTWVCCLERGQGNERSQERVSDRWAGETARRFSCRSRRPGFNAMQLPRVRFMGRRSRYTQASEAAARVV